MVRGFVSNVVVSGLGSLQLSVLMMAAKLWQELREPRPAPVWVCRAPAKSEIMTKRSEHERLQATACRRLNVGSGQHPLPYWTNLDEAGDALADVRVRVPPLPYVDEALDEVYAGHFLEHLMPTEADDFLIECHRCLTPGGRLGIVVPDTREVVKRYVRGDIDEVEFPHGTWHKVCDLDEVCRLFLYSTVQESTHRWSYDLLTLKRLIVRHGFSIVCEIDRFADPRIPVGAWYQCGWDAVKSSR